MRDPETARAGAAPPAARPIDLFVVRPTMGQGGAARVTVTLLQHLDRRLFRPSLVLMRAEGSLLREVPADVPVHDLSCRSLWTAWWPLAALLRRARPRILLSTSGGANLIAALARRLGGRRVRLVLSERNVLHRDQGALRSWLQLRLKRVLYPSSDCVTAVSQAVAEDLKEHLRLPATHVRVVHNPVVTPEIAELAAREPSHPWFAEETPIVLGVGRLVRAKGFDLLIEAFARVRAGRPARLVLLGDGPQRGALRSRAERLGLAEEVWLAGFDPNPFRYLARCTVFVLPSRYEGLPGALIQAMACGAAVVATDCPGGSSEVVEDGITGFLVPADDADALASRIGLLLEDPEIRRGFGERARAAAQRFSLGASLQRYVDALLGRPSRADRAAAGGPRETRENRLSV